MQQVAGIIAAIIILSLMLFLHELGHFIAGRKLGFNVEEFSIFMGPRLVSWEKDGIRYSIKAFPIGASVAFSGEYPEDEGDSYTLKKGDFYERPIGARFVTLIAGPGMNILTAILVFSILFAVSGFATTTIGSIENDSLASRAEVMPGEKITRFNDTAIRTDFDLQIALMTADPESSYTLETKTAEGESKTYRMEPEKVERYKLGATFSLQDDKPSVAELNTKQNPGVSKLVLGDKILSIGGDEVNSKNLLDVMQKHISSEPLEMKVLRGSEEITLEVPTVSVMQPLPLGIYLSPNSSALEAIPYTFSFIGSYMRGTFNILGQVFAGRVKASESFTGPVGIVDMFSGVMTSQFNLGVKLQQLLRLFAVISLALGVTNLLPIPPLDGGQLVLLLLEKIRGKRLSLKAQSVVTIAGIVFVLALGAMALGFDIKRILMR